MRSYVDTDAGTSVTVTTSGSTTYPPVTSNVSWESKNLQRSEVVKNSWTDKNHVYRPPSSYSVTETTMDGIPGDVTETTDYPNFPDYFTKQQRYGSLLGILSDYSAKVPDLLWPSLNEIARAEVDALIKAKDQKVNLAQAYAERHQTIELIGNKVYQLAGAIGYLRKGNYKAAAKALGLTNPRKSKGRTTSQQWLELIYGWMPLLQDIEGLAETVAREVSPHGQFIKVTRDLAISERVDTMRSEQSYNISIADKQTRRVKISLWYALNSDSLRLASTVGFVNPLEVLWEVTPFSFLVDWLIPVGNLIQAFTADMGLSFVSGTQTLTSRVSRTAIWSGKSMTYSPGSYYERTVSTSGLATQTSSAFKMQRSLYYSSPIPVLYYKNPFSGVHFANAAALLRTNLKGLI